eukprot:scaffold571885_cov51-Prasinocladus_malaysianus.AAC.1
MLECVNIKDVSVGGGSKLQYSICCELVPEVAAFRTCMGELVEVVTGLEKTIGPTLLMLLACLEDFIKEGKE